jgi:hypothetical protein
MSCAASRITVSVLRPRKSTFSKPIFSMISIGHWLMERMPPRPDSPLVGRWSGTYWTSGLSEMMTPAAWLLAWRATPSSCLAVSTSSRTRGSLLYFCSRSAE